VPRVSTAPFVRARSRALSAALLGGLMNVACDRPSPDACERFAEHMLTVAVSKRAEKLSPALREGAMSEAMKKKAYIAERCMNELDDERVSCAMSATTPEALERCGAIGP
jgi:hypothetical protein